MMLRSDDIKELAGALAKAQGEMTHAVKDAVNPHFKSRYADLASVWDAIREPLTKHGLSVVQTVRVDGSDHYLDSLLLHSSGQYLGGSMKVIVAQAGPQALGSALTYARRYALSALVGVAPDDDDDGNAATGPRNGSKPQETQRPVSQNHKAPVTFDSSNQAHVSTLKTALAKVDPAFESWDGDKKKAVFNYVTHHQVLPVEAALVDALREFLAP